MKYIYIAILLLISLVQMSSTPLNGVISSDMVLKKSNSPFTVTSDLVIGKNADIKIESGVELVLSANVNITVLGSITTDNSTNEKVSFIGAGSNWGSIIFYSASDQDTSRLDNILLRNGGSSYHSPIMIKSEIVPNLTNIEFVDCSTDKIELTPFDFSSLKLKSNDLNYLINNDFIIPKAAVFQIAAGSKIYIKPNVDIICKGSIIAEGDFQNPIIFDADESALWGGISIESELLEQSIFEFCRFSNFGNSQITSYAGINVVKGSASIEYSEFNDFNRYAVIIKKSGLADLGGGFAGSKGYNQFGLPNLSTSVIVSNYSASNISAQYNCWGTDDVSEIDKKIFDAKDNSTVGMIDYSNYLNDCSVKAPNTPILEYPHHYATDMPTNLKCTWFDVQSADLFHFQIATDSLFKNVVSYKDNLVDTFAIARNLKNGKKYFWRARSVNMAGNSEWSEFYAFKTFDTTKPEPPVIIYPKNNGENISTRVEVSWTEIENADNYVLQWSANSNFSEAITDTSQSNALNINLKYDSEYYIRVKAGNQRGWSAWSLENQFTTAPLFSKQKVNINVSGDIKQSVVCNLDNNELKDLALRTVDKLYLYINTGNNYTKIFETNIADVDFDYADYDNDNDLDFVAVSNDKNVIIIENKDAAFSIFGQTLGSDIESVFFYDYDQNLVKDIVTFSSGLTMEINIYENILTGFVPKSNIVSIGNFTQIRKDDFDNDGKQDFLLVSNASGKIVEIHDNSITEKQSFSFLAPPSKLFIRDIDADGLKDIITLEYDGGIACIYDYSLSNNYIRMSLHKEIGINNIELVDLSNNGYLDFVISYDDSVSIKEYVNNAFFDYYNIGLTEDYNLVSYCSLDKYNNDLLVKEANAYYTYINNTDVQNANPLPPTQLSFSIKDNSINLSWNKGSDAESFSLAYSIEVYNSDQIEENRSVLFDIPFSKSRKIQLNNIKSGRYKWRVRTHDNTFLYSALSEESEFITPDLILPPPASWNYEKQTGEHSIIVLDPSHFKDSVNMHSGMYIGVFYINDTSLSCAGYAEYTPSHSTAIPIWGDNYITSMVKEGFNQKEFIRYKLWDGIKAVESYIQVDFEVMKNQFLPDKVFKAEIAKDPLHLEIKQSKNTVKYISSNLELCDPFNQDYGVKLYDVNSKSLSANQYVSPLSAFYSISDKDLDIQMLGYKIDPMEYKIQIKKGWNLLPYLKSDTSNLKAAFEYYSDKIICIKDDRGNAYIPQFNIETLDFLIPGNAYLVYSFEDFDFYYNDVIDNEYTIEETIESIYSNDFEFTGNTMSVILICEDAPDGSSVALKSDNKTFGNAVFYAGKAYVNVWGDNLFTTEIDGLQDMDDLSIELYDSVKEKTQKIIISSILDIIDSENQPTVIQYKQNTLLAVNLTYDDTSVEDKIDKSYLIENNKVESKYNISAYSLYDYAGNLILKENEYNRNSIDVKDINTGYYILRFEILGNTFTEKLIINK